MPMNDKAQADLSAHLIPSTRIAFAAFLHDLGKFAERAAIDVDGVTLESNQHLYCPHHKAFTDAKGWFSHKHAAYTAIALDLLEQKLPALKGHDVTPFAAIKDRNVDDSMINAAAKHHRPETFLQWIIATADRIASGFEREEFEQYNHAEEGTSTGKTHYTARQLTLFEQIRLHEQDRSQEYVYRYRLSPLSPAALMPVKAEVCESNDKQAAQQEYRTLWEGFIEALNAIPKAHQDNLPLWLDHFETLWGCYTHAIPSATAFNTRPDVSLYDHSRTAAALAVALWRYHHERGDDPQQAAQAMRGRNDWDDKKFLLIQGDFFGIQDFIFASGSETQKQAARLLRGRSFYVSLLTECAALKVLDTLGLPSTSQVTNAAGKFLIVAPNTTAVRTSLEQVKQEFNDWFLRYSWGTAGVGLATLEACSNDFLRSRSTDSDKTRFEQLLQRLFEQLETAKMQRFGLCGDSAPEAVFETFLDQFHNEGGVKKGVCSIDGRSPAVYEQEKGVWISQLARDQIDIGNYLVKEQYERLLITRQSLNQKTLKLPLFGYHVSFTQSEDISGKFGALARDGSLLRAFDFALPKEAETPLWNGYARRHINAYAPRYTETDIEQLDKYGFSDNDEKEEIKAGNIKPLDALAYEDRQQNPQQQWYGTPALIALKGDVDNLGQVFQQGLKRVANEEKQQPLEGMSFAKMAGLSRQMNAFFSIYLPFQCQQDKQFRNTYTVFAGGDDFFLIGPWHSQIRLANAMHLWFKDYTAHNPELHFSAGLSMTKPGLPIRYLADRAEHALDHAKRHQAEKDKPAPKNAVSCYGQCVTWAEFDQLMKKLKNLETMRNELNLSTAYLYGLLQLIDMAANLKSKASRPESALWHSWFAYRTRRLLERTRDLTDEQRRDWQQRLGDEIAYGGIERFAEAYKITLFTYLYQQRD